MIHNDKRSFLTAAIGVALFVGAYGFLGVSWGTNAVAVAQKTQAATAHIRTGGSQQPIYTDYKGVRIGITTDEARAKLGVPTQKGDDSDFYVVSEKETAQIWYDASHKVMGISVDYLGGIGAPDYKTVVGPGIETRPDGSLHKLVRYENLGFWVSYHRSAGTLPVVTITIQKFIN